MQVDELIWKTIAHNFCSYKVKTTTQNFCRNEYNVTGLCNRQSCPLANSRYATVKENNGVLYLYVKTIERAHTPSKMWEKIKLSKNYVKALEQIDNELIYWPDYMIHRCKQRMTKITQYLIRMRKLRLKTTPTLVGIKKKVEKREMRREAKAEAAARLETSIEKELLDRLRKGVYGSDGIVNESQSAFNKALDEIEDMHEQDIDELEEEEEDELEDGEQALTTRNLTASLCRMSGLGESDDDGEAGEGEEEDDDDEMDASDVEDEESSEDEAPARGKKRGRAGQAAKRRRESSLLVTVFADVLVTDVSVFVGATGGARVEVEYEHETEPMQTQSNTNW
ncbi:ribosomal L28e protein family-domain-containing protein [Entophlyctis helioformis]|nr:ribosomal L28e protein family-domain-containing protein [Entophlyctis helioformis]